MFHLATLSLGLIVAFRFLGRLPIAGVARYTVAAVVLLVSVHHLLSRIAFGTMFSPEVPRPVMIVVNWLFVSILLLALFQIALEIYTLVRRLIERRRIKPPVWMFALVGIMALAASAFGVAQALRLPMPKTVEIAIKGLPRELDGFRILQLTDLHISRLFQAPWVTAMVEAANRQDADLIVISGDLIDGTLAARRADVEPLKDLRSRNGVYVIPGNHEYYFGYPGWMERFSELGLRPLANSHTVIGRADARFVLAGVTDLAAGATGFPRPDIAKAIEGAPAGSPVILLNHQPREAGLAARAGVALQLSGHTHGGMIMGLDRIVARANNGFVSGLYAVEGMPLYVNNGTALWIGFAVRLGVPSELTTIVLRAA
ncbi:metallophosphoesterase [Microvirga aerilata]|uniref:Metallophosphoesterase n=1 Tax=Microvirga aerilata TaxID=670292 RepID=A0A937CXK2_9HYPH|nr:metallophosphoesterase [Microvirga aerilata]MBL0405643.1 metallophosphoesterase [Microvirga aerilata]